MTEVGSDETGLGDASAAADPAALDAGGAVCVKNAIPMSWIESLRTGIERSVRDLGFDIPFGPGEPVHGPAFPLLPR